jgi:hypothetical protein
MSKEAAMSKRLAFPSGSVPLAFIGAVRTPKGADVSSMTPPALVSDSGDDYEMSDEFAKTWLRTGDRLIGFVMGGAMLTLAWAIWWLS